MSDAATPLAPGAAALVAEAIGMVSSRYEPDLLRELVTESIRDRVTERDRMVGLVALTALLLDYAGDDLLQQVALDVAAQRVRA